MLSMQAMQTLNCVFIVFRIPHLFQFCFALPILFSRFLMQCPLTKTRVPDQCHGGYGGKEEVLSLPWSSGPLQASPYPGLPLQIAFILFFPHKEKEKMSQVSRQFRDQSIQLGRCRVWTLDKACIFCLMAHGLTEPQNSCTKFGARYECAQILSPVVSQGIYILLLESIKN